MSTRREQIIAAVRTAITGTSGVGTRIYRSRQEAFTRDELPSILIEPVQDTGNQIVVPLYDWELLLRISVMASGSIPDQSADSVVQSMHSLLMVDDTLGGLAMEIFPAGVNFLFGEADMNRVTVSCDYRIRYRTSQTDLSVLS